MVLVDGAGGKEAAAVGDIPCHCHFELWAKEARIGGAGVCENRTPLATPASQLPNLPTEFSDGGRVCENGKPFATPICILSTRLLAHKPRSVSDLLCELSLG